MAVFITPTALTWQTAAVTQWNTYNLTGIIPSNATGVILNYGQYNGTQNIIQVRKKGSTDSLLSTITSSNRQVPLFCGVDGSQNFEFYTESGGFTMSLYVLGYFTDDATFFTNATALAATSAGSFQPFTTYNLSSSAPNAIAAIIYLPYYGGAVRKNGSTDNFSNSNESAPGARYHIVGLDSSQICQMTTVNGSQVPYLMGYITKGITWNLNAILNTPSIAGSFQVLPTEPNATGYLYHLDGTNASSTTYSLSATTVSGYTVSKPGGTTQAPSGGRQAQINIASTSYPVYELGYFTTNPTFKMYANGAFQGAAGFIETGVGSISFNGTSQYLSASNTGGWLTSSGTWTVEAWVYLTAYSQAFTGVYSGTIAATTPTAGGSLGWNLGIVGTVNSWTVIRIENSNNIASVNANYNFSLNTWYHVAAVSVSGTVSLYVNGVSQTTTGSNPFTFTEQTALAIGRQNTTGYNYYFPGYITNLRIVNGTAVYTSNFTPPTSALTAVANTKLLLDVVDSATYITDSSPNKFTVTPTGSPTFVSNDPFLQGMKMYSLNSTVQIGNLIESIGYGSISFNGSTQYLQISSLPTITGTGTFTIEAWVYPLDYSDQMTASSLDGSSNLQIFRLNENGSGTSPSGISVYDNGTQVFQNVGGGTYPVKNQWTHLAWVKNGTTNTLYINGISSATYTGNVPDFTPSVVGAFYYSGSASSIPYFFNGYITNYRVVNGVAVYTSNFIPPSRPSEATQSANVNGSPSAAITGTQTKLSLAALSSSAYLTDSSTNNFTVTPFNSPTFSTLSPVTNLGITTPTQIPTKQKLYANGSYVSTQFIEQ